MLRTPTRSRRLLLAAFALALAGPACGRAAVPSSAVSVRFVTGTPGAGFYALGEGLAREFARALPHLTFDVLASDGAATNIEAIQRGEADIGLAHADVTYLAYTGRLDRARPPFTRLRGMAMLQLTRVHVVVRGGAGIRRVEDLRGRRISLGRPGYGSASTAALVLQAYGIGLDEVTVERLRYDEAATRLAVGTLDALLVTGTYPLAAVTAATRTGARVLPLDGVAIDRLRAAYPFFTPTTIPAGAYPNQPTTIRTIGVDSLLVCRADLDEATVHDLTQQLFEVLPTLSLPELSAASMDFAQASATPIPLHEGAARYYRERELLR